MDEERGIESENAAKFTTTKNETRHTRRQNGRNDETLSLSWI
jgi:hypothetical protein